MSKILDLSGKRFGGLLILHQTDSYTTPGGSKHTMWVALCDCGVKKAVRSSSVVHEGVTSCGCLRKLAGSRNHRWKGFGEISGWYWAQLRNGAKERGLAFDITIQQGWELFEKQGRRCAFTDLPISMGVVSRETVDKTASLDRRDNCLGYVPGNVQWVHKDINRMRNVFTEKRFIELCKAVAENYSLADIKDSWLLA